MKRNTKVREAAKAAGVCLWQVAEVLGMQESAFSRKLRYELPTQEVEQILGIIDQLAKEASKNESIRSKSYAGG